MIMETKNIRSGGLLISYYANGFGYRSHEIGKSGVLIRLGVEIVAHRRNLEVL